MNSAAVFKAYMDAIPASFWGILGTIAGSLITHYLSKHKTFNDKVREKKLEIYSLISSNLFYANAAFNNFKEMVDENPTRAYEDVRGKEARNKAWELLYEATDTAVKNRLILSHTIRNEISYLLKTFDNLCPDAMADDKDNLAFKIVPVFLIKFTDLAAQEIDAR